MDAFLNAQAEVCPVIDQHLMQALTQKKGDALSLDIGLAPMLDSLISFAERPGKRLRPFLAYWGYLGAGGLNTESVIPIAAASELLHVFALVHDDVMDQSALRRGLPTVHSQWSQYHQVTGLRGVANQFGESIAILLGDLALVVANSILESADVEDRVKDRVRHVWNQMREEVIEGQFLDVLASYRLEPATEADILSIVSLKSGKYTLERPLHLGAAAANASDAVMDSLSAFGIPLGRAFQIQDDILGVFGASDSMGKPVDSDIREGKSTLLISRAYQVGNVAERELIRSVWGNSDVSDKKLDDIREVIRNTGALAYAKGMAEQLAEEACTALSAADITQESREILLGLSIFVLSRQS